MLVERPSRGQTILEDPAGLVTDRSAWVVVRRAVFTVAEASPCVGLVLKADLRAGHDTGQLSAKVERVEQRLRVSL